MSLVLGFVSPLPPPAYAPAPPRVVNSPKITNGPINAAKPITGRNYPRARPAPPPPPPPPPAAAAAAGGAAGGLTVGAVAAAVVAAIAFVLFFDSPAAAPTLMHPPDAPKDVEPPDQPFSGGQSRGVLYLVTLEHTTTQGAGQPDKMVYIVDAPFYGPIVGVYKVLLNGGNCVYSIVSGGRQSTGPRFPPFEEFVANSFHLQKPYIKITGIRRQDSNPDTGGNPPPLNNPTVSAPGNFLGPPVPGPPATAPSPIPRAPGIGGSPGSSPGSSPGDSLGSSPGGFPSPSPAPNPGPFPQPNPVPNPQPNPGPFPQLDPGPTPGPGVGSPSPSPAPAPAPAPTPSPAPTPPPADPTDYPDTGLQPDILTPNPLTPGPGLTPNPLTENPLAPSPFIPNPDTGNPQPVTPQVPAPPRTPQPDPTPTDDFREDLNRFLGPLTVAIAGITGLVQPERLREAAQVGSCQSFAPGGCNAPIANNAQNAANNSANNGTLLAQILAFLQALQAAFMVPILAGVNLINTKLGPVMAGVNGIGGFLARTAEAAKLDKVLNAMNTVLLLHNAAMLSRNLGSTLGDLTSSALATIGIKDGDSPIDVNEILGKQANSFMESLVGAEVWKGTKTSWNKASSIISSATNLMYTMRSIFDSTREIAEWTAENTGKIGNALKRFRVVGENAYKWLPERVTVQNSFTRKLDRFREGVDDLDDAASSLSGVLGEVQSIQQEYADLQEQKQKFDKNISELTPKPREENKPVSDAVTAAKNVSKAPTEIENVFRGEGEKLDA